MLVWGVTCPHIHTQSTPLCTAAWGLCGWCLLPTPRHNSALSLPFPGSSPSLFSVSVSHTATSPPRKSCLIPRGSPTSPQSRAPQPAWPTPCSRSWPAHTAGARTAPAPCSAQRVSDCPLPPTALKPKVGQTLPPPRSRERARGGQHDPLHHHHHHHHHQSFIVWPGTPLGSWGSQERIHMLLLTAYI